MNKEAPFSLVDIANDIVIAKEDRDVAEMFADVELMEKRNKGSHTVQTRNELRSAEERLSRELDRLSPTGVIYDDTE